MGSAMMRWPKPPESHWTDEQWEAIAATGNNILVAAAAGSGKTAVLVERIIRKITDPNEPVDVDRLLIVTFTHAAAGEMRQRIGEALARELEKRPESRHLRRQLTLLNRAMIATLHSFCMSVVRKYYYRLDLDPNFRIADEVESELLQEEVLETLFEDEYSREDNAAFFDLVDRYGSDRSDVNVQRLVRRLYDFSRSHPSPDAWLDQMAARYEVPEGRALDELPWTAELIREVRRELDGCRRLLAQALDLSREPGGPSAYAGTLEEDLLQIDALLARQSWEELHAGFQALRFGTLPRVRQEEAREELKERVKQLRQQVKGRLQEMGELLFSRPPAALLRDLRELAPVMRTLVQLVQKFGQRYWEAKKAKGLLDFSDLEHLCLQVLTGEGSAPGQRVPSEAAQQYQEQFVEVLVDEYQDTNLVQEAILRLVTRGNNLFMVGDVKQSIYRFRLAEPGLFLEKYKSFTRTGEGGGLRIDLSRNFRSRSPVLAATNFVFRQLMDEQVGEVRYDEAAELKPGAVYPDAEGTEVELVVIDRGRQEKEEDAGGTESSHADRRMQSEGQAAPGMEEEEELETAQLEARWMARQIQALIQKPYLIYDKDRRAMRPVTYRDIVILLRSMPWAPVIMEELKAHGIPVYAELSGGYFEAVEVATMLSLLKVIDNPDQDIPLAAVLRSPIVGLREDELAAIRLQKPGGSFWEAVKAACRSLEDEGLREKVVRFCRQLERWRARARQGALSELIWQIYRETGYLDFVGGMPGGKQRQANLRALYDRARAYESTSFRGLFRFLRFVERMQERGDDLGVARALGEQEDVVRLMTIHKSKGLEFPVVFVGSLGKSFNLQDLGGNLLLHKDLGIGSRLIDPIRRLSIPTLPWLAIGKRLQLESAAEEMRILYVAMTRAREKLYLVGTVRDGQKAREKWSETLSEEGWLLLETARARARSFLDWLGPAIARHRQGTPLRSGEPADPAVANAAVAAVSNPEVVAVSHPEVAADPASWKVRVIPEEELKGRTSPEEQAAADLLQAVAEGAAVPVRSPFQQEVARRLSWDYPHLAATHARSKQTVSELKRRFQQAGEDEEALPLVQAPAASAMFRSELVQRPRFLQKNRQLTPAERGTATHLVMQHLPLSPDLDERKLREWLERMVQQELLTPEEAAAIPVEGILRLFATPVGQRLLAAPFVRREVPFSYALPAEEVHGMAKRTGAPQGMAGVGLQGVSGDERHVLSGRELQGTSAGGPQGMSGEVVLLQGVIDCLFRDERGLVLLDYKTDTIYGPFAGFEQAEPVLKERYALQLQLYARAVEAIWGMPVAEKVLYFFDGGHLLPVP
ncbi:MAG: helicase-exonuclease AddAB subunit AddA [Bacillus thermozeamaize]|uniref:ATP-dependent helicase/nuclease subunit A n=1 Tax=Bacillus thermozeamaize TaxID=230954 RepID=A0A1Y3PY25_9BACI|nr:MAG: helicase-exonuclease AddAB subunit AddA [Bacillus thermozeamaize]